MKVFDGKLEGVKIIYLDRYGDERGFFEEGYRKSRYLEAGIECEFVQANHSFSKKGVVRGMHFQRGPGQAKLVSCVSGEIYDVVVDMRVQSSTYGQWMGVYLKDSVQLFVPEGFGHGFCVVSDEAHVSYLVSTEFDAAIEGEFRFDDAQVGIEWPVRYPVVSARDLKAPAFGDLRVWVVGKSGGLARALRDLLPWAVATGRDEVDVTNEAAVSAFLDKMAPQVVLNASGYTAVDGAESDEDGARLLNCYAVELLGRLCFKRGIRLVHVSTDFVFDGEKDGPYCEEDEPRPLSVYGRTKLEGEKALMRVHPGAVIVRTSWVYGCGRGFAHVMRGLMGKRERLEVVDDQVGRPTELNALAKAVWNVRNCHGIYHFASSEPVSRFDWAMQVWEESPGVCREVRAVKSGAFGGAKRPKNSVLATEKYERLLCED